MDLFFLILKTLLQDFEEYSETDVEKIRRRKKIYYLLKHKKNKKITCKDFFTQKLIKVWNKSKKTKKINSETLLIDQKFTYRELKIIRKVFLHKKKLQIKNKLFNNVRATKY